jgi:hypothetical protein
VKIIVDETLLYLNQHAVAWLVEALCYAPEDEWFETVEVAEFFHFT